MAAVRLEQVRKVYPNGQVAVQGASFEVADGELMVLVGPSGCGKSTLLRMIAGLEDISSGSLHIGDRLVNEVAPKDRDIAMVFQSYALYPHMTAAENLAFGLKLRGMAKAEIRQRVDRAATMLGMQQMLDKRPGELSGGQRQRVALGRALVRDPAVFLLDEPLSNLDAKLRHAVRAEIAALHRQLGTTMIYVTHDQIEAMTLGQRIVVMNEGRIQQIDTPMALYERPANLFVAGFLGSPAMNVLRGTLLANAGTGPGLQLDDGGVVPLVASAVPEAVAGRALAIGLRPEHLCVVDAAEPGFQAEVEAVEPVGNEAFIHLRHACQALVMRCPPQDLPVPGQALRLGLDHRRWHLFDAASGERLSVPG